MKRTALFGALIAVCSIGAVSCPTPVLARAGAGGLAAGLGGHGMRAGPAFFHHGPLFTRSFAARRALRPARLARHPISVMPYWPIGSDFAPFYYYPPAATAPAEGIADPVAAAPPSPSRILVAQPGCRTQEQQVPSEAGGTRLIHITRCY
jgi:hypothetical protein